jgi:hypothetical protein
MDKQDLCKLSIALGIDPRWKHIYRLGSEASKFVHHQQQGMDMAVR